MCCECICSAIFSFGAARERSKKKRESIVPLRTNDGAAARGSEEDGDLGQERGGSSLSVEVTAMADGNEGGSAPLQMTQAVTT